MTRAAGTPGTHFQTEARFRSDLPLYGPWSLRTARPQSSVLRKSQGWADPRIHRRFRSLRSSSGCRLFSFEHGGTRVKAALPGYLDFLPRKAI